MKITIINGERSEKRYTRVELEEFVEQLRDGTYRIINSSRDSRKEVCFAAEWIKNGGELKPRVQNPLVLLSLENLRDLATVREYKEQAIRQLYTLLCFIGDDGHSLHIVCRYDVSAPSGHHQIQTSDINLQTLTNAFRKLHYIYSTQLGTQVADHEPTLATSCKTSYDPQPYYNPSALAIAVSSEPEETPEYRIQQEDISDFNYPDEIPGMSVHESRMRRFHDCYDAAYEAHIGEKHDGDQLAEQMFATAVLEQLADGCRQMGLPQAWCARVTSFIPRIAEYVGVESINSALRSAYLN